MSTTAPSSIRDIIEKFYISRYKNKIVLAVSLFCMTINVLSWQDNHNLQKRTLLLRPSVASTTPSPLPNETMIPPAQINDDVDHRLSWNDPMHNPCRDILLTMPDEIRKSGQGAQLNHYLL
ncbi:hypothetical protein ACHAW6_005815 [Cyclotella cf. meneghiniana]